MTESYQSGRDNFSSIMWGEESGLELEGQLWGFPPFPGCCRSPIPQDSSDPNLC